MSNLLAQATLPTGQRFEILQGDITAEKVDAIVNAANKYLLHGGGVAAAIVRRGGEIIQEESDRWIEKNGLVPHNKPAYTSAGDLPCKYVIHAVGPIWGEGDEDNHLTAAVTGSLSRADELSLTSIAFPAISTGIFGFPKERAARIIYTSIRDYFLTNLDSKLSLVRLVIYDRATLDAFLKVFSVWT